MRAGAGDDDSVGHSSIQHCIRHCMAKSKWHPTLHPRDGMDAIYS